MLSELLIRRFPALKTLTEAATGQRSTGWLSTAVAQCEAEGSERARSGRIFTGYFSTTGLAPVQAIPTTAATWALYNADSNRALIIDEIAIGLLSGTATIGGSILAIVSPITATLPANATGAAVGSNSLGGLSSKAILATGYTLPTPSTVAQWGLLPLTSQPGGVPGVGGQFTAAPKGKIIVPPGKVLGLALLAGAGTSPLYVASATWTESELDLE